MLSKSVKAKRRHQAACAAAIEAALRAAVVDPPIEEGFWPSCDWLNWREGWYALPVISREIAKFPAGSKERGDAAFSAGSSGIIRALGYDTPYHVLHRAGLL